MQLRRLFFGSLALLALAPGRARAAPVTVPNGVADALPGSGTGLCAASAIATNPSADFDLPNPNGYMEAINGFIEAHAADRVEHVLRSALDLSNNNSSGLAMSYGDFIDAALPECKTGGCDFFANDSTMAFASRLRGFFNVTPDLVNKPIHFGFYADDSVSFTVYDNEFTAYPVVVRPPELGFPSWRMTNQVTFSTPGLYPIEILYTEIAEHAALEMSYFIGDFTDFERPANQPPIVQLDDAGFTLFEPSRFFQTLNGDPSYPDLGVCKQCDRQFINQAGNNGCDAGDYCNEAALCAPCDMAQRCGPTCAPCGGDTPFCVNLDGNLKCGECRADADCADGATCDPSTKTCNTSNSPAGTGGADGSGGSGGSGAEDGGAEGGCGCRAEPTSKHAGSAGILGLAIAVMGLARSRRRTSRASSR
ncbi:outer membrane exchange protein TraA family protein [Polyangium spumosum]|uniref:TraA n=1 Tax=Polyangium spumosum TaxID=889282 RepID=A0A6N7PNR8_9BACT|nr:outer membrane exchange protein TraA family protein [Polyangium spumosum]MRG93678.1 hypothetical protein [Polyangium spumosum]